MLNLGPYIKSAEGLPMLDPETKVSHDAYTNTYFVHDYRLTFMRTETVVGIQVSKTDKDIER